VNRPESYLKRVSLYLISLWLVLFTLLPLLLITMISFSTRDLDQLYVWQFTGDNYWRLFNLPFFKIIANSLQLALLTTFIVLLLAYPCAFIIAKSKPRVKNLLLVLMIVPFWTSSLIRTYAILTLLKTKGVINSTLLGFGLIHVPLQLIYTNGAVVAGVVYNLLPFMVLPIYSYIEKQDPRIFEAARDLGASRLRLFFRITLPLTMPGIIAGTLFVYLPAMTLFYIPDLLGGAKSVLLGNLIENQFLSFNDWPGGAATSVILTLLMLLLLLVYRRISQQELSAEGL